MNHWICVPVKPFSYGKSRLADMISDQQRYQLNRALFSHTLQKIQSSQWKENAVVISKGEEALDIAASQGIKTIVENPPFGLNRSLRTVSKALEGEKAASITVLHADLILLTAGELDMLYEIRVQETGIIIVPDRFKAGTNILSVMPVGAIPFRFGRNSFNKHIHSAATEEIPVKVFESTFLGFDLDTERDLLELERLCPDIRDTMPEITCFENIFQ